MNVTRHFAYRAKRGIFQAVLTILFLLFSSVSAETTTHSEPAAGNDTLIITGSEFYQRSQFDAGEIRIFLKNIGTVPVSISDCKLSRLLLDKESVSKAERGKIDYLYSKLTPPILMPGREGQLLLKFVQAPLTNSTLICTICDSLGNVLETTVLIEQAPVWISYVGFSENLRKVYVYVQNTTKNPFRIRLLEAAGVDAGNNYSSINKHLPAGDKGSLVFELSAPLTSGEYVKVAISAKSDSRQFQTQRIVRAVNKFPLMFEDGTTDQELGLDAEKFFVISTTPKDGVACVQNMACPAHAHGTHKEAAIKFLNNYLRIYSEDPYLLTQMWICRVGQPQTWYKFGPLADISVVNPVLLSPHAYRDEAKALQQFNPFIWLSATAKKAAEPNRYLACVPIGPEDTVFLQNSHTSAEVKFLVYCSIAAGAKGILYRDRPSSEKLFRSDFIELNKELQKLKPLLMIAEPVGWASMADDKYTAKSLLCGDEAILVIVFDCRYFGEKKKNDRLQTPAFEKRADPVEVKVAIPKGTKIVEVRSLYRTPGDKPWDFRDGELCFTADMVSSVRTFMINLVREDKEKSCLHLSNVFFGSG